MRVYKICDEAGWRACEAGGELPWSSDDRRDGFVHLSSARQVRGSCERHFAGRDGLWLLELDPGALPQGALRWEPSRDGQPFPHLYGPLLRTAVVRAASIVRDGERFVMPSWLPD